MVAQRRPRVAVARDCGLELRVQYGRHITRRRTDAVRSTGHVPPYNTVRAKELARVTHKASGGALAELVGHQADEPRHSGQLALAGKLHLHAILAGAYKAPKKNRKTSLKDAVAGVTGAATSDRRTSNWLADMRHIPHRDPLHRPVPDVEHTRPNGVHVVCP